MLWCICCLQRWELRAQEPPYDKRATSLAQVCLGLWLPLAGILHTLPRLLRG
jgi:hypothetical protein